MNLVSTQKHTNDLSYSVTFHNDCCIFQDKESLDVLEKGVAFTILKNQVSVQKSTCLTHLCQSQHSLKRKKNLFHCRLGHPSFGVIKVLFPSFIQ